MLIILTLFIVIV